MSSTELNPAQKQAAERLDGPVLVTAGAGSGKTRMLTRRFVNAVMPGAVPGWTPASTDEVIAITFTEKAAGEIEERVREELTAAGRVDDARALTDAWISTIHGLCARILRRHALEAGIDPLFTVGTGARLGRMMEEAFERAAISVVSSSDEGASLFDGYPYDAVFSACRAVTRQLTVAGLTPDQIELEPAADPARLVVRARELFAQGALTHRLPYSGSSTAPSDHAEMCGALYCRCELLDPASDTCLDDLLRTVSEYKPLRSLKGIETISAELKEQRRLLIGGIAATITAPYARVFRDLVARFVEAYDGVKAQAGTVDFDDLQAATLRLLEQRPDIAEGYRRHFRAVMVDEFQDTDAMQLRLVELLSGGALCTVGDEKQSIYRFRGADVDVYREHRDRMAREGAHVSELAVNYRSRPELLDFVNTVFGSEHYFGGGGGRFLPLRAPEGREPTPLGETDPCIELAFVDLTDIGGARGREFEARLLASRLRELRDDGAAASDMVVLVRRYGYAHVYADALAAEGMSASIVGGNRFFSRPEIATMRALARVIADPGDDVALSVLVASRFASISAEAMVRLRDVGEGRDRRPLWEALRERSGAVPDIDGQSAQRLVGVVERARQRLEGRSLGEVLLLAVEEAGWDLRLLSRGGEGKDAYANVLKFTRDADEFESAGGGGLTEFTAHIDASEALGEAPPTMSVADARTDTVRIMSIHAAKGLEFPIVAVPELASSGSPDRSIVKAASIDGRLRMALKTPSLDGEPLENSTWFTQLAEKDKLDDEAEGDRVLYVAFTRAREKLLLSGAMGLRPKKPTQSKKDLARLARVMNVTIPVEGESDCVRNVPGTEATCRVRVVIPDPEVPGDGTEGVGVTSGTGGAAHDARSVSEGTLPPVREVLSDSGQMRLPDCLSFTQLGEFAWCPRLFWVRRVLGVGFVPGGKQEDPGAIEFGSALHLALRLVDEDGTLAHAGGFERIARQFRLSDQQTERLREAVARYFASELAARARSGGTVRREAPFRFVVDGRFTLNGAIDLYSRTGDEALVVDYKSGVHGNDDELAEKYRLQAECYALAVLKDGCARAEVVFARVETDDGRGGFKTVAYSFDSGDARSIERDLAQRYARIESSEFEPTPSTACAQCTVPESLCDARPGWTRSV